MVDGDGVEAELELSHPAPVPILLLLISFPFQPVLEASPSLFRWSMWLQSMETQPPSKLHPHP